MEQKRRIQSEESLRLHQKRLAQAEKRIGALDRLFIRLEQEQQAENIGQFVQREKRNSTRTERTSYALRELVKAVYVDAPDKSSGKRRQKVHIEYDLVGYIPVDELLKAEQA